MLDIGKVIFKSFASPEDILELCAENDNQVHSVRKSFKLFLKLFFQSFYYVVLYINNLYRF